MQNLIRLLKALFPIHVFSFKALISMSGRSEYESCTIKADSFTASTSLASLPFAGFDQQDSDKVNVFNFIEASLLLESGRKIIYREYFDNNSDCHNPTIKERITALAEKIKSALPDCTISVEDYGEFLQEPLQA